MKQQIMNKIPSFPPLLPMTFTEVIKLTRKPDVSDSNEKIAELIEKDPFLKSNVLCLANALYFGSAQKVHTVGEILNNLGAPKFLPLLFATSVAKIARESERLYDLSTKALWEHLIGTAIGARKLAEALKREPPDYLCMAALTHDIGKIVLGTIGEVHVESVISFALKEKISFEQAEREIIGIDHGEVGACLLEAWNFPPYLVDAVRFHHRPQELQDDSEVVNLVHIADALCMMAGVGTRLDALNYMPSTEAMSKLGLEFSALENILYDVLYELMQVSS